MTLLPVHIIGGLIGIAAGYVALSALKGASLHRKSGMVFVYAMLIMSASGAMMAMLKLNRGNVMGGALTFYMVATALLTIRPRVRRVAWMDLAALLLGLSVGIAAFTFGVSALHSATGKLDGYPPPLNFIFGTIALLSAAGDTRMLLAGGLQGAPRIARHLWRMCFALFIAAASFFLVTKRPIGLIRGLLRMLGLAGQFPQALRIPALFAVPVVVPLLAMLYWLWRVRIRRTFRGVVGVGVSAPKAHLRQRERHTAVLTFCGS